MLRHLLTLSTTIAVLIALEKDKCEIGGETAICNNIFDVSPRTSSGEIEGAVKVLVISASGDLDNNTLQFFPEATHLQIFNCSISSVSLGSNITSLNVSNSIIPKVTNDMLKGATILEELFFISNPDLRFEDGAFRGLGISDLIIANQSLPNVRRRLFEGLQGLIYLRLISDGIRDVDEDAFQGLINLDALFLDQNPIESLHVNFSGLERLTILSLLGTNLKRIDFGVLSTAKSLYTIGFPTKALIHMNVTELVANVPYLGVVGVFQHHILCPGVAPVLEDMKDIGIEVKNVTVKEMSYFVKFFPSLKC